MGVIGTTTFVIRYRRSTGSIINSIRRDGALYYIFEIGEGLASSLRTFQLIMHYTLAALRLTYAILMSPGIIVSLMQILTQTQTDSNLCLQEADPNFTAVW